MVKAMVGLRHALSNLPVQTAHLLPTSGLFAHVKVFQEHQGFSRTSKVKCFVAQLIRSHINLRYPGRTHHVHSGDSAPRGRTARHTHSGRSTRTQARSAI